MSIKNVRSGVPVDWGDAGEASLQAKIDVLRNMIAGNPMTYSEKDELVKEQLSCMARRASAEQNAKTPAKKWKI